MKITAVLVHEGENGVMDLEVTGSVPELPSGVKFDVYPLTAAELADNCPLLYGVTLGHVWEVRDDEGQLIASYASMEDWEEDEIRFIDNCQIFTPTTAEATREIRATWLDGADLTKEYFQMNLQNGATSTQFSGPAGHPVIVHDAEGSKVTGYMPVGNIQELSDQEYRRGRAAIAHSWRSLSDHPVFYGIPAERLVELLRSEHYTTVFSCWNVFNAQGEFLAALYSTFDGMADGADFTPLANMVEIAHEELATWGPEDAAGCLAAYDAYLAEEAEYKKSQEPFKLPQVEDPEEEAADQAHVITHRENRPRNQHIDNQASKRKRGW